MGSWFKIVLFLTVVVIGFNVVQGYNLNYDIDSYIDRAQYAADREDMVGYLNNVKDGMERWNATSGHTALIFKTPANDLALHYQTITRIIERLESIKDIPKNETAYQVALDDLRGTIRELPNPAMGLLWVKYWFTWLGMVAIWAVWAFVYRDEIVY